MSEKNSDIPIITYCMKCKQDTESKELKLQKSKNNRLGLRSICVVCDKKKHSFISKENQKKFPRDIRKALEKIKSDEVYHGGLIPLLPILGLIFAGVGAASGVAGTVANTVINKQKAEEEKRFNDEKLKIMKEASGNGLDEDSKKEEKRSKKKKTIEQNIEKCIKYLEKHNYKITLEVSDESESDQESD